MTPCADLHERLEADIAALGERAKLDPELQAAIGATMFDLPGSEDNTVTVLLRREHLQQAPAGSLLRIVSRADGRRYLGVVSAGPFAQPDSLRADAPVLVTVATRGGDYLPQYHGRVQVTLLGEELSDGSLTPPRLRPLPNSPVLPLDAAESARMLHAGGDVRLGLAVGFDGVEIGLPSDSKAVLPRHLAVLGTTGGGKSTTVSGLVKRAADAGVAVVLLDVEGEYSHLHQPTDDPRMLSGLAERGLKPGGVPAERMTLYHLVGRDTANPRHPRLRRFSLQFARLSPYMVIEILDLSDAQQERFLKAYDIAKDVLRDLNIFPVKGNAEQERLALEIDEFERGYPRLTLSLLLDVVGACLAHAEKQSREGRKSREERDEEPEFRPYNAALASPEGRASLRTRLHAANPPGHAISWRALLGRLWRLHRLQVFDRRDNDADFLRFKELLRPGQVSVIDLSDSGMSQLNNLVIADLLHGLQEAQDEAYRAAEAAGKTPPRALVVIEEAHEFLSEERVERMRILFEQVARIAKRGRKRWLGLCFVTQLPQHLPRQVLGLVNSFVLHKITDPGVVSVLRKTVSGIDEGLWARLPGLAPGQALVSLPHLARPLLASVDPTPARLRLVD
jgi:DNA helicase HerA-like ATPase